MLRGLLQTGALSPQPRSWDGVEDESEYLSKVILDALAPDGHLPVVPVLWEVPPQVHKVIH